MTLLTLLLWGAATLHCPVKQLAQWDCLSCCSHAQTEAHPHNDCEGDSCVEVESGEYFLPAQESNIANPPVGLGALAWGALPDPVPGEVGTVRFLAGLAPPELQARWGFLLRTAPRVRAPSLMA